MFSLLQYIISDLTEKRYNLYTFFENVFEFIYDNFLKIVEIFLVIILFFLLAFIAYIYLNGMKEYYTWTITTLIIIATIWWVVSLINHVKNYY